MNTGITIRAYLNNKKVESIDIGDPKLDAEQLLRWMAPKDDQYLLDVIRIVRETILGTRKPNNDHQR